MGLIEPSNITVISKEKVKTKLTYTYNRLNIDYYVNQSWKKVRKNLHVQTRVFKYTNTL